MYNFMPELMDGILKLFLILVVFVVLALSKPYLMNIWNHEWEVLNHGHCQHHDIADNKTIRPASR
jgi:hypothetical protein